MADETFTQNRSASDEGSEGSDVGIVYVATNAAMPGLVKIGRTENDVAKRVGELYRSPGVPVPFDCVYAVKVANYKEVENALHQAFPRLNPRREFFEIEPEQVIPILSAIKIKDVTPDTEQSGGDSADNIEIAARDDLKKKRRPPTNFANFGIPVGAELRFERTNETATVVNDSTRVSYKEGELSISRLTAILLGSSADYVSPLDHWTYEGRLFKDLSDEAYGWDE